MTHSLPIPKELTALVESGFWPRDHDQARAQNLHSLVPESRVRRFAPEEDKLFLLPPPFFIVSQFLKGPEEKFWADPRTALHEIDPDLTLLIGDFGLGSDAPIALDYRKGIDEPRVIRLRWSQDGNHWVEVAPTFAAFAAYLAPQAQPKEMPSMLHELRSFGAGVFLTDRGVDSRVTESDLWRAFEQPVIVWVHGEAFDDSYLERLVPIARQGRETKIF
jgi:hypothetical protein